jgi:hypothetical protein
MISAVMEMAVSSGGAGAEVEADGGVQAGQLCLGYADFAQAFQALVVGAAGAHRAHIADWEAESLVVIGLWARGETGKSLPAMRACRWWSARCAAGAVSAGPAEMGRQASHRGVISAGTSGAPLMAAQLSGAEADALGRVEMRLPRSWIRPSVGEPGALVQASILHPG